MSELVTMRRLAMLLIAVVVSIGAWAGWGVYGWAAVTLAFALFLFYRSGALLIGGAPRAAPSAEEDDELVAVSGLVDQFEAELMCQALEAEGIAATYGGREVPDGMIPGGGVRWGRTRVAVRERDAKRASDLLAEVALAATESDAAPHAAPEPEVDVELSAERISDRQSREAALAVFGADSSQSRPWRRLVRWVRG
jgi:hypothetical protein